MFGVLQAADGSAPALVRDVAREFSPRIDICGPLEVVLDLSGLTRLFGDAREIADAMRRTAADRGLRVRVATAATRTAARLMVRHRAGVSCIEPGTEAAVLAPLPLAVLAAMASAGDGGGASGSGAGGLAGAARGGGARRAAGAPDEGAASVPGGSAIGAPGGGAAEALLQTFTRWGVRTLGELAALPPADVAARVGQAGVCWQALACGEDLAPLVPSLPEERFEQAFDLEWPIDGLEPLSFVLSRLMEPLAAHLQRRGRAAAVLRVRLHLVTREVHERALQLPAAIRDPRTLRTLALLDLESHPPPAAIDRVVVAVDPTPERILQHSLLTRPLPPPAQMATLMARLSALVGEGRCGAPAEVEDWSPGACAMRPFVPIEMNTDVRPPAGMEPSGRRSSAGVPAYRRFRVPVPVRVRVTGGAPVQVFVDRRGLGSGAVQACAGPWRTSGAWWHDHMPAPPGGVHRDTEPAEGAARADPSRPEGEGHGRGRRPLGTGRADRVSATEPWDRDEWDVTVSDGTTYRLFRDRVTGAWFIDAVLD